MGKGPMDFGKGPMDFGKGPMDFGKGPMNFGKGPMDFGKSPMDMGKGPMDFGKGPMDMGKGTFVPPPTGPLMPGLKGATGPGMMPPFSFPGPGMPGQLPGLAPDLLALTSDTMMVPPPDIQPLLPEKKLRLFLLLTRLAPDLPDEHVQRILEQCGEVQAWRRGRGANGDPLSFGFAQFSDAEAAWKASTCISKLVLCGHEVKILMEEQTEILIQQWRAAQQVALKVNTEEELEWELERKSVSCKAAIEAKMEELYGPGQQGGGALSKRRQELRQREQARIARVRKRKAWREGEFSKELEQVESLEKRFRRDEKEQDGIDRTKEQNEGGKKEAENSELAVAKKELNEDGGEVGSMALATISDSRVLHDLVDRVQKESRDSIFRIPLDVMYLRNEKILEKKLRPWLEHKVDLYMGGPQSDLVEYILRRMNSPISADIIVSDLMKYLDDHAEPLVERMWRMLIFEIVRGGQSLATLKAKANAQMPQVIG